jgi:arylsulfatase A-like enzyme
MPRRIGTRRPATAACALLAFLIAHGCAPRRERQNLLLVLVDTLRADHLSLYGYPRKTSPNFDRFARQNLFFPNARSQAACTFPSVNSLLTSRYAMRFLDPPGQGMGIPEGVAVLPDILQRAGYATAAISASPIVRVSRSRHNPGGGFGRGFASFDESCIWRDASCVNQVAFAYLRDRRQEQPFFLYLHYLDPHGPYSPPPSYARRFASPVDGPEWLRKGDPNVWSHALYEEGAAPASFDRAQLGHLVDLYDDEIRFFDSQFGALLHELDLRGLRQNTVVAFVADHGEQFLEHDGLKHCRSVYDVEVHTPLALRVPGRPAAWIERPVENLDLAPTLLALLGVPVLAASFEGRDLFAADAGARPAFSAQGTLRAATGPRFKLVYDVEHQTFALFDLQADPGETRDVKAEHPDDLRALRRDLFAWLQAVEGSTTSKKSVDAARAAQEQLKSLGYLE